VNTDQESLAAGLPMGDLGGIGAMVSYMDYGTFPGRDAVGNITPDYTVDRMGFMLGWGKEWTPGFSTGLALQGGVQSALGYSYSVWSGDVGLLYQFDPHMRFGAALVDFGGDLSGDWAAAALRFGVSYDPKWVGPHRLLVDFDGTVEFQGVNRVGVGAEYSYQSKYFLRAGYEFHEQDDLIPGLQDLTAGAGIRFDDLELDYAYLPYGELGTSQQISLSYFFPCRWECAWAGPFARGEWGFSFSQGRSFYVARPWAWFGRSFGGAHPFLVWKWVQPNRVHRLVAAEQVPPLP
jgi:hypothetical protein